MDIMLDLETAATFSDAAILSIGAVKMDLKNKTILDEFYMPVALDSAVAGGGKTDPATLEWWEKQSQEAKDALKDGQDITLVLSKFSDWVLAPPMNRKDVRMWGNGADFDNVILGNAYRRLGYAYEQLPWSYGGNRCFRTIKSLYSQVELKPTADGVHHHALHDAIYQAKWLFNILHQHERSLQGE